MVHQMCYIDKMTSSQILRSHYLWVIFFQIVIIIFFINTGMRTFANCNYQNPKIYITTSRVTTVKKIEPTCNTTLMGQFNYISSNISVWNRMWSKQIKDIVIATPIDTPIQNLTLSQYMFYQGDRGTHSPYSNMAKVIKENKNICGLLYVHDDLLITGSIFHRLGGNEWISTVGNPDHQNIRVYQNGTFFSNNSKIMNNRWVHWKGCHRKFMKMFRDERLESYLRISEHGNVFLQVRTGQSDMLYAFLPSSEQTNAFLELLDLFTQYKVYLECAIPTAMSLMQERFGIKTHNAPLCTDWSDLRRKPNKMIEKCLKNGDSYEIFHPVKISQVPNWTQYFDNFMRMY